MFHPLDEVCSVIRQPRQFIPGQLLSQPLLLNPGPTSMLMSFNALGTASHHLDCMLAVYDNASTNHYSVDTVVNYSRKSWKPR